jgi:cellulose synthase/poly-beta-1,6-N-acetylglucosamine synthase-like glycosyltransferase
MITLLIIVYLLWLYQMFLGISGFGKVPVFSNANKFRKFAILIPAHNEEKVIGQLIDSLHQQDYPWNYYDIFVSCDFCRDRTEEVVASKGEAPLIRREGDKRGKTWNISWALDQIDLNLYEAVVFFDADNLVQKDFLSKMNAFLEEHPEAEAVQGQLKTKNPDDSYITRMYTLNYWFQNRFWSLARANRGLSSMLGGTGMLIRTSCLKRIGWNPKSLTEDLEFSAALILDDSRVFWNYWAVSYDEKPISTRSSRQQRSRWLQGQYWVFSNYGKLAFIKWLKTGKLQFLDLFITLASPGKTAIFYIAMVLGFILPFLQWLLFKEFSGGFLVWGVWPLLATVQLLLYFFISPYIENKKWSFSNISILFHIIWYGFTWLPFLIFKIFQSKNQNQWVKTEHNRSINIHDVKK